VRRVCPIRRRHRAISALRECWLAVDQGRREVQSRLVCYYLGRGFPVSGPEMVDGDVGSEMAVCWEMSRVNSKVISGLFDGRSTASLPEMPQCTGAQIKTTLRCEGVRTRFKRISIR